MFHESETEMFEIEELIVDKDFVDRYGLTSKSQKDAQMNDAN